MDSGKGFACLDACQLSEAHRHFVIGQSAPILPVGDRVFRGAKLPRKPVVGRDARLGFGLIEQALNSQHETPRFRTYNGGHITP